MKTPIEHNEKPIIIKITLLRFPEYLMIDI